MKSFELTSTCFNFCKFFSIGKRSILLLLMYKNIKFCAVLDVNIEPLISDICVPSKLSSIKNQNSINFRLVNLMIGFPSKFKYLRSLNLGKARSDMTLISLSLSSNVSKQFKPKSLKLFQVNSCQFIFSQNQRF